MGRRVGAGGLKHVVAEAPGGELLRRHRTYLHLVQGPHLEPLA